MNNRDYVPSQQSVDVGPLQRYFLSERLWSRWKTAGEPTWHIDALDPEGAAAARIAVIREREDLVAFLVRLSIARRGSMNTVGIPKFGLNRLSVGDS